MIELKCQNCNSADIEYKDGLFICKSCGSRFLAEKQEKDVFDKEDKLEDAAIEAYNKHNDFQDKYLDTGKEKYLDKSLEWTDRLDQCIERLLEFNPMNPYAWTFRMVRRIGQGFDDGDARKQFFEYAEKAADALKPGAKKGLVDLLQENFWFHSSLIVEKFPEYKDDADRIRKKISEF